MAGIGFQIVKLLRQDTYQSSIRAYALSTVISSGTMLFTLLSIGFICFFTLFDLPDSDTIEAFLVIVVNLFAGSMILSAFMQYTFFRYAADLVFLKAFDEITPNFLGVLLVNLIVSFVFGAFFVCILFPSSEWIIKLLLVGNFCVLNLIWIAIVLLSGFKSFKKIGFAYFVGYSILMIGHAYFEQKHGLAFLLFGFLTTQTLILGIMMYAVIDAYPTQKLIQFNFLKRNHFYFYLFFANFFFNCGFWVDKYLFWFSPHTGNRVYGLLSYSPIYDVPMLISMLSIIPATSVFTLKLEGFFAEAYPQMMDTIFKGRPYREIETAYLNIVHSGRDAFFSAVKVQFSVTGILCLLTPIICAQFNNGVLYLSITLILLIAGALYFILWAMISFFYYMTKYKEAFAISLMFLLTNLLFTFISMQIGPEYFGYGFALSLFICMSIAVFKINRNFKEILYFTFMMTEHGGI